MKFPMQPLGRDIVGRFCSFNSFEDAQMMVLARMANTCSIATVIATMIAMGMDTLDPGAAVVALCASVLHVLTIGRSAQIDETIVRPIHVDVVYLMRYWPYIVCQRPRNAMGQTYIAAYTELHVAAAFQGASGNVSNSYAIPALDQPAQMSRVGLIGHVRLDQVQC